MGSLRGNKAPKVPPLKNHRVALKGVPGLMSPMQQVTANWAIRMVHTIYEHTEVISSRGEMRFPAANGNGANLPVYSRVLCRLRMQQREQNETDKPRSECSDLALSGCVTDG